MKYFEPPALVVDKYEMIKFLRGQKRRNPNAPKGFIMKTDTTAPLTHEEALPMLRKKRIYEKDI